MSEPEAAYVGAMLDGEGWVTPAVGSGPLITIGNTGVEIMSALLRCTGIGTVYYSPPGRHRANHAQYRWSVMRQKDVLELCERIKQYSVKAQWLLNHGLVSRGKPFASAKDILVTA